MQLLRNREKNLHRTKRGRIICKSTEIYGRNDIGCGSLSCKQCVYLQPLKPTLSKNIYLIPDSSTINHQIDIITAPSFLSQFNVILLQSTIESIKKNNYSLYKRIESELIEGNKYNASIYLFMNNFNKNTKIERVTNQSLIDFEFKQMIKTYKWYLTHLNELNDTHLFIINESAKNVKLFELFSISAIKMDVLVNTLFPSSLSCLSDSLSCAVEDKEDNVHYRQHWSMNRVRMELINNSRSVFKGKYHSLRGFGASASGKVGEICIIGLNNINRAIHDDIVIVKLLDKCNKNEGEIVCILERKWRAYCGSLEERKTGQETSRSILFVPIDSSIPKIKIISSQISSLMNKRIIVHIDEWKITAKYPSGHYTETIGVIGDLETETQVLLLEHDIPYHPWSDAVLSCLPPNNNGNISINTLSDLDKRRNLITEGYSCIFSVDPVGCVDIDDALHCKILMNGNIEVGVHIADVSYYVKPNTPLDNEAAKRGTSVYLVDRRIDMLPSLLSTDLCSLKPNKARLSFSVFWEIKIIKRRIQIVSTSFSRCIIRSATALSYGEAQDIINDDCNTSEVAISLRNLLFISKLLKEERIEKGALSLSSLQPKFTLNKNNDNKPSSLESYKLYETNSMIEEFMLFANISVAKRILTVFPSFALLRRHPSPTKPMLSSLIKYAAIRGFKIDAQCSKQLSLSLDRCVDINDKSFNELIRIITTRCMTQAVYFISGSVPNKSDYQHYGLASSIYTHFTSPIRRYADIIVHRQLAYCCGYYCSKSIENIKNRKLMNDVVYSLNRRHRLAQYINRASCNLYTLMFFDNISSPNKAVICSAIISGIESNCLNVFISKYCMERRIYLDNKNEWKFDCVKLSLSKVSPPAVKYQVFDKVSVRIFVYTSKYHRKKLIVDLIDNNFDQVDIPVFCDYN